MASMNNVCLIGRSTKEFEIKKTNSGLSVVQFILAVNRRFKNDNGPDADFINCVAWRQQADFLGKYGQKGQLMSVEGALQTRNYVANDGHKVYVTEVVANQVSLLEKREQKIQQAPVQQAQPDYTNATQQAQPTQQVQQAPAQQTTLDDVSMDLGFDNNDLPF